MDFKKINEQLEKFVESNLPEFQKMDKLCDLDNKMGELIIKSYSFNIVKRMPVY